MHAIGHAILRNNPEARVAYLSTEKFTNEFIQVVGFKDVRWVEWSCER